jgi:hypothetical protein
MQSIKIFRASYPTRMGYVVQGRPRCRTSTTANAQRLALRQASRIHERCDTKIAEFALVDDTIDECEYAELYSASLSIILITDKETL